MTPFANPAQDVAVDSRAGETGPRSRGWSRADAALIAALGMAAFLFTQWYVPRFRAAGGDPSFYQIEFSPAVMLACGRGFHEADYDAVPAFSAFLHEQTDALRCGDIPPDITIKPLNGLQGVTRYLMVIFSLVWWVTGVSWRAADVIISAFAGVTVAAAYAAVRVVCARSVALGVTLFWACSPRHLQNVPHLRDYSKAPFFMALLVALGVLFVERRPKRLVWLGAAFGAIQGFGFGMRTDMVMNFVPFLLVLAVVPAIEGWHGIRTKAMTAAASVLVFAVVSFPIIRTYAMNSSLWHVVLLGLTSPYDENLNIGFPRPAYSFPYAHNDAYIVTVVRAFWARVHPADPPLTMVTRPYDRACREYFLQLASMFPGDMATRAASSAILVADLPFWLPVGAEVPEGVHEPSVPATLWRWRARLIRSLDGFGPLFVCGSIAIVGALRRRYALIAFAIFLFWAAFPVLEFQGRHTFHFEFAVLATTAAAATLLTRMATDALADAAPLDLAVRLAMSAGVVALLVGTVAAVIVAGRIAQKPRAAALIDAYANAPATPLTPTLQRLDGGRVRLGLDLFHAPITQREQVQEAVIRADFDFSGCGRPTSVDATFRYLEHDPRYVQDFSRTQSVGYLGPTTTTVFLPVYAVAREWRVESQFAGVDLPASFAPCVRLSQVDPGRLPLAIPVTIAPDWPRKLYARLRIGSGLGY